MYKKIIAGALAACTFAPAMAADLCDGLARLNVTTPAGFASACWATA